MTKTVEKTLATMSQTQNRRFCLLRNFRKHQKDKFAPCGVSANAKKTILPLAEFPQTQKRQISPLRSFRKHQKDKFTPCGVSANTKKTKLPLAGFPQGSLTTNLYPQ
jgi:hypothetical protein